MPEISASIRQLSADDFPVVLDIINAAAKKYGAVIPIDCYHEPYMSKEELAREMTSMTFFGFIENGSILGVMGFQPVADVTLIRHAYVWPEYQRSGIGTKLLAHLKSLTKTSRLLVGTWSTAHWAVRFYQKQGFQLDQNPAELLSRYWKISARQIETSVVLSMELEARE